MSIAFPEIRVGDPRQHNALSVFPLFCDATSHVEYRLSEPALADESLLIEEVDSDGSVPDLLVENKGDIQVLFIEGEELIGAKQNRILNTSVLVAAHSKLKIPVSCVERGRWRYKSRYFGSSGSYSPPKLRQKLKASVSKSVKADRSHRSDQGAVWDEVDALHAVHSVQSHTAAMSDAFDCYEDRISAYKEKLEYVEEAVGVAVAIGERIVSVDVFDKPDTCRQIWEKMLAGVVFDAIEAGECETTPAITDVQQFLNLATDLPWQPAKAVGTGEEFRAESQQGDHATALAVKQTVVHGSLVASM